MEGRKQSQAGLWSVLKLSCAIFLPVAVVVGVIMILIYRADVKTERTILEINETYTVEMQMEAIAGDFRSIVSDLMFLAGHSELQELRGSDGVGPRKALGEEFLIFSEKKRLYDQIRFLDETGMEVVRVNFSGGKPYIVPDEELQSKAHRYYFKETIQRERGEVYVSPFDLNIEHGEIERPLKPMIRFGTPVFDRDGRKRGAVLFNYLGGKLIQNLRRMSANTPGQVMLLNSDGFWLQGPKPEDEWGFMFKGVKKRGFGDRYPEAWQRISGAKSGQFHIEDGMFTFKTVYPLLEALKSIVVKDNDSESRVGQIKVKGYSWKIVSYVSPDILNAGARKLLRSLIIIYVLLVAMIAIISWFFAYASKHRKIAEEALRESEARYRMVHATSFEGIIIADAESRIMEVNPRAEQIFGYGAGEMVGSDLARLIPEDLREQHHTGIRRFLETGKSKIQGRGIETEGLHKSGERIPVELTVNSFSVNKHICFTGTIQDITERKRMENKLRKQATTDTLTQTYNRRKFEEIIDIEMERAKRFHHPLSILMFDIDNFKKVNDTFGHSIGDYVLKTVADIVRKHTRTINYFIRWGGEEFVIISVETDLDEAKIQSERLRKAIESYSFDIVDEITASFGVTQYKDDDTASTFIKRADDALYQAKVKGKNRVEINV